MEPLVWGVEGALEYRALLSKDGILQYGASVLDVVSLVVLTTFDHVVLVKGLGVRRPGA